MQQSQAEGTSLIPLPNGDIHVAYHVTNTSELSKTVFVILTP